MRNSSASLEMRRYASRASGENFGTSSRRARMISLPSFTSSAEKLSSAASSSGALLEQRVAGADGVHVTLEQRQITRLRLREQQIQKPPPRARRAFDELQIFRAKNHRAQRAKIIRQLFHRLAVQRQFAFARRPDTF